MNKMLYPLTLICLFILNTAISQTISISGKVVRHNGDPVEGVTVTCTNAVPVTSADDGSFTFTDLPEGGDYHINGMYTTDVFEGITALDLLFTREMYLLIVDFSEFQLLAGDFNQSGSFSLIDLVEMSKASVKINGYLPATYWHFFDQANFLQGGISLENVTEDTADLELVAAKLGDVAIDSDHFPPPPGAPQPLYYIPDTDAVQDEEVTLEIRVNDFNNIVGFQHDLSWNPAVLEFIETQEGVLMSVGGNDNFLDEGHFLISNGIDNSLEIDDGTVLYSVKFKALQEFTSLSGLIEISETMIPRQTVYRAENDDLFLVDESFVIGESVSTTGIASLEKFDISPNPAHDEVFVKINFENAENAELSLYDVSGRLMNSWKLKGNTFEETIGIYNLPAGTYVLKLRTQQGVVTKKLMKH